MTKYILIIVAAIVIGLLAGWLATKVFEVNEKARKEAKEKLDKEFLSGNSH